MTAKRKFTYLVSWRDENLATCRAEVTVIAATNEDGRAAAVATLKESMGGWDARGREFAGKITVPSAPSRIENME